MMSDTELQSPIVGLHGSPAGSHTHPILNTKKRSSSDERTQRTI